MAAELVIAPEVEQDPLEAYGWYERQRAGLGETFLLAVDACIQAISRTPTMHPTIQDQYRRGLIRRFPYAVFYDYVEDNDVVTVYCVFHTSRDPMERAAFLMRLRTLIPFLS